MGSGLVDTIRNQLRFMAVLSLAVCFLTYTQARTDTISDLRQILDEANHIAATVDIRIKVQILPKIAIAQAKAGDLAGAKTSVKGLIEEVWAIKENVPDYAIDDSDGYLASWQVLALVGIASAQGKMKDTSGRALTIEHARHFAERLQDSATKVFSLQWVAVAQVKAGDIRGAQATTQKALQVADTVIADNNLSPEFLKNHVAMKIATVQVETGDRASARAAIGQALQRVKGSVNDRVLLDIAIAQARLGDMQGALETLQGRLGIFSAVQVAEALSEAGERMAAGEIIQKAVEITQATNTVNAFDWKRIAMAKANLGDIQGAMDAQRKAADLEGTRNQLMSDPYFLSRLAVAQSKAGDPKRAMASVDAIHKATGELRDSVARAVFKSPALRAVAAAQVTAGDIKGALAWAHKQRWPDEKAYALLGVAEGLLEVKQGGAK